MKTLEATFDQSAHYAAPTTKVKRVKTVTGITELNALIRDRWMLLDVYETKNGITYALGLIGD